MRFLSFSALIVLLLASCGNKDTNTAAASPAAQSSSQSSAKTNAAAAPAVAATLEDFVKSLNSAAAATEPEKPLMDLMEFPFYSGHKRTDFVDDFATYFSEEALKEIQKIGTNGWEDWSDEAVGASGKQITTPNGITLMIEKKNSGFKIVGYSAAG